MIGTEVRSQSPAPLSGVRVLDLTRVLAGPYCTMILADLGADVVKVERPEVGDDARHFGPFLPSGQSAYFASVNRGKKSIVLNLKQSADRERFLQLVERADVVVENFRAGTMDAIGLSATLLLERNPRLVYASLSGFGQAGLHAGRPAYDVVIQAMSGLMSITGEGPGRAVRVGTSASDILTGLYGAIAVLAALRDRDQTGVGTIIDLAMLDCTVSALENAISRYAVTGQIPRPQGTRHPSITPFQAFETADGPVVIAAGNDVLWTRLCHVLGCPEWTEDRRFATNEARTENRDELERLFNGRLRETSRDQLLSRLEKAGIPCAPIRNMRDVLHDPHLLERGMLHRMDDGDGGTFVTAGSPLRMGGQTPAVSPRAPELGADTEAVLRSWLEGR